MIQVDHRQVPNGDGWLLSLRRTVDDCAHEAPRKPLLIIPGYGMNSFIFGFHPQGVSMEVSLARRGFEVWSADLRGQGRSSRQTGSLRYGLADLALIDVASAVDCVLETTATKANEVDLIGCSLGGTLMFIYAAFADRPRAGGLVNMGGAVRWVRMHPLMRAAFASPKLVGLLPLRGVRRMASVALPLLRHAPRLLSVYLHPDIVDLSQSDELVETVENPNRHVNREIAEWIRRKDLWVRGKNVSDGVRELTNPLLSVLANADGIVPRESAIWPHENMAAQNAICSRSARRPPRWRTRTRLSADTRLPWCSNPWATG